MLCPRQNRRAIFFWILLFVGFEAAVSVAETNELQHNAVIRTDSPDREVGPQNLAITTEGRRGSIVSVMDASKAPMSIALVIDAGPNQSGILNREKEIASSLISKFSDTRTEFIVVRAGYQAATIANTSTGSVAVGSIQDISPEPGQKSQIPVYKAVASAIEELSLRPGMRVLIIIAEGNDSRSGISYKQLRASAQAQHVSVMTALVADHSTRGSKAILSYGWFLDSLAADTAGIFIDNDRNTPRVVNRLEQAIRSLRLVTFEIDGVSLGCHKMRTSSSSVGRLHAQKDVFIRDPDCQQRCCRREKASA